MFEDKKITTKPFSSEVLDIQQNIFEFCKLSNQYASKGENTETNSLFVMSVSFPHDNINIEVIDILPDEDKIVLKDYLNIRIPQGREHIVKMYIEHTNNKLKDMTFTVDNSGNILLTSQMSITDYIKNETLFLEMQISNMLTLMDKHSQLYRLTAPPIIENASDTDFTLPDINDFNTKAQIKKIEEICNRPSLDSYIDMIETENAFTC